MQTRQKAVWLLLFFSLNVTAAVTQKSSLQSIINTKEQSVQSNIQINTNSNTQAPPSGEENTQEYGLAFIFSASCPHCQKFAPTLEAFAATTGLYVYAFSVDGKGIHTYTQPLAATAEVMSDFFPSQESIIYPALFLVNLNTRKHVPLSLGNVPFNVLNETYKAAMTYPHIQSRLAQ